MASKSRRKKAKADTGKVKRGITSKLGQNHRRNKAKASTPASKTPKRKAIKKGRSKEAKQKKLPKAMEDHKWKKGQSGNPGGRPKGSVSLTTQLRKAIEQTKVVTQGKKKMRVLVADLLIDKAIQAAQKGKFAFFKEIFDRMDGKVPDHVILESTKKIIAQETQRVASELLTVVEQKASEYLTDEQLATFLVDIAEDIEKLFGALTEQIPIEGVDE